MTGDCLLLARRGDVVRHRKLLDIESDGHRTTRVRLVWEGLVSLRQGDDQVVFEAEALAEACSMDTDQLSTALGWLEQTGHLVRRPDSAAAGMVGLLRGRPDDPAERALFIRVVFEHLSARIGQRRRIADMDALAASVESDRDVLERLLVDWTMHRYITFQPTQRRWRARLQQTRLDEMAVTRLLRDWRRRQHLRLDDLETYIDAADGPVLCRRVHVARTFGDAELDCLQIPDAEPCDVCDPARPHWHATPLEHVPDPEKLIDVETVILQAVRWAGGYKQGHYGEAGLKYALLGQDQLPSGRPLSSGILTCPQFGALKYLRGAQRRLSAELERLVRTGIVERRTVTRDTGGQSYETLSLTPLGLEHLTGIKVA
jgi:ATP-dependent DNA helicase RecQ